MIHIHTKEGRLRASAFSSIPFEVKKLALDGNTYTIALEDNKNVWILLQDAEEIYSDEFNTKLQMMEIEDKNDKDYNEDDVEDEEDDDVEDVEDDDEEDDDVEDEEDTVEARDATTCATCEQPGFLIVCDKCEQCFHLFCAGLADVPIGTFHCATCKNAQPPEKDFEKIQNPVLRQDMREMFVLTNIASISPFLIAKVNSLPSYLVRKAVNNVKSNFPDDGCVETALFNAIEVHSA